MRQQPMSNQFLIKAFGKTAIIDVLTQAMPLQKQKVAKMQRITFAFFSWWYPQIYLKTPRFVFNKLMFRIFNKKIWNNFDDQVDLYNWQMRLYISCKRRKRRFSDKDTITPEKIAQAKLYPLERLLEGKVNPAGFISCPFHFHSEKTPSFKVYRDQNTWCCFGACGQQTGDAIDLVMELNGLNFIEAVKFLNRV